MSRNFLSEARLIIETATRNWQLSGLPRGAACAQAALDLGVSPRLARGVLYREAWAGASARVTDRLATKFIAHLDRQKAELDRRMAALEEQRHEVEVVALQGVFDFGDRG